MEKLEQQIIQAGMGNRWPVLKDLVRGSVRMNTQAANDSEIRIGLTKIGGRPDLPEGIQWPSETITTVEEKGFWFFKKKLVTTNSQRPLSFIAQINFAETRPFDLDELLPKSGILYVFYAAEQDAWGFSEEERDKFRIIYQEDMTVPLARREFPEDLEEHARFNALKVELETEGSLPSDHPLYEDFDVSETEQLSEWQERSESNKLLGYPNEIQGEMEWDCELVSNGMNVGTADSYKSTKALAMKSNAKNWILLLQIDSNDDAGMMWGDCGRLYFWIKRDDLLNKRFDKCWFAVQCY